MCDYISQWKDQIHNLSILVCDYEECSSVVVRSPHAIAKCHVNVSISCMSLYVHDFLPMDEPLPNVVLFTIHCAVIDGVIRHTLPNVLSFLITYVCRPDINAARFYVMCSGFQTL